MVRSSIIIISLQFSGAVSNLYRATDRPNHHCMQKKRLEKKYNRYKFSIPILYADRGAVPISASLQTEFVYLSN